MPQTGIEPPVFVTTNRIRSAPVVTYFEGSHTIYQRPHSSKPVLLSALKPSKGRKLPVLPRVHSFHTSHWSAIGTVHYRVRRENIVVTSCCHYHRQGNFREMEVCSVPTTEHTNNL
jgi:hypothetical protein